MKVVALYLRVSKEDEDIQDESNSISNQRMLLRKFVMGKPELAGYDIVEFKDDGYTGKNMDRPDMVRMLEMIKAGKVEAVLCKDLSRFSRDHLELGKYMEQIFPFLGVRFIAVNDNYDSINCRGGIAEIDVAFKEILYDYYSEDLSVKVKSSLRSSQREGKFIGAFAPYGANILCMNAGAGTDMTKRYIKEFIFGMKGLRLP